MSLLRTLGLVFAGGAAGGGARLAIDLAFGATAVPWDVLAVNVGGSAALGFVVGLAQTRGFAWWYPAVGPGLLGGFTTFSAIAVLPWATTLAPGAAAGVLGGTMAAAVAASFAGWALGDAAGEESLVERQERDGDPA